MKISFTPLSSHTAGGCRPAWHAISEPTVRGRWQEAREPAPIDALDATRLQISFAPTDDSTSQKLSNTCLNPDHVDSNSYISVLISDLSGIFDFHHQHVEGDDRIHASSGRFCHSSTASRTSSQVFEIVSCKSSVLKTHQRGPRTMLRSKSPDLVVQEIWGHLRCHYAIRSLMAEAAAHCGLDPDRISFVAALRITRRALAHPGTFSPDRHGRDSPEWLRFLRRLLGRLNPARRHRSAPRVIKRKYLKWHVKRAAHAAWPQPGACTTVSIYRC